MTALHYKDTRVSPSSAMGTLLLEAQNPRLSKAERAELMRRVELIYQDCEAEYRKYFK